MGLRKGIERAFWLIGFTSGARQSFVKVSILSVLSPVDYARNSDVFTPVWKFWPGRKSEYTEVVGTDPTCRKTTLLLSSDICMRYQSL